MSAVQADTVQRVTMRRDNKFSDRAQAASASSELQFLQPIQVRPNFVAGMAGDIGHVPIISNWNWVIVGYGFVVHGGVFCIRTDKWN